MMTKKHYIAIASVLQWNTARDSIIAGLCSKFEQDNPRFDRETFIKACNIGRTEEKT